MVKPQLGLPVVLTNLTRPRLLACVIFAAVTLVVDPYWPLKWWPQALTYDGFVPVFVGPAGLLLLGVVVFVALINWRDRRTRFLCLTALMPQRGFFDALPLAALPASPPAQLLWSGLSWVAFIAGMPFRVEPERYPQWLVLFVYFPLAAGQVFHAVRARKASEQLRHSLLTRPIVQGATRSNSTM